MYAPDTTYEAGLRRQFAALAGALILGPENTWAGEDAYYGNPVGQHQGGTTDLRYFTPGQSNATAAGQPVAASALVVVVLVVVAVLLVKS